MDFIGAVFLYIWIGSVAARAGRMIEKQANEEGKATHQLTPVFIYTVFWPFALLTFFVIFTIVNICDFIDSIP
jgi:hypothetical protein